MPAACASPEKACSARISLVLRAFSVPYVSYATSTGASFAPLSRDNESKRTLLDSTIILGVSLHDNKAPADALFSGTPNHIRYTLLIRSEEHTSELQSRFG